MRSQQQRGSGTPPPPPPSPFSPRVRPACPLARRYFSPQVRELQKKLEKGIVIALAANKVDLASRRKVESDEAAMYASENGLLYCETSAKDSTNIESLFLEVARRVPKSAATAGRKELDLGTGAGRKDGQKPPVASGGGGCCG